jgi:DNA invertase Pin-like site-specific DNA recombinase
MRTAMRQMMGVFAQLERAMINKRLRNGRKTKAEQGGFAYGSPAFGQKAEGGELVADAREQAGVGRIAELHRDGKSLREIIGALDSEGIKPKREGAKWHPATVSRIIQRLDS